MMSVIFFQESFETIYMIRYGNILDDLYIIYIPTFKSTLQCEVIKTEKKINKSYSDKKKIK